MSEPSETSETNECCICYRKKTSCVKCHCVCDTCLKKLNKYECPVCRNVLSHHELKNTIVNSIQRNINRDKRNQAKYDQFAAIVIAYHSYIDHELQY